MAIRSSEHVGAPSALPRRSKGPQVIRTSKADEHPSSSSDFWAVARAAALVVLAVLAIGYAIN
jgi:hypothetical protein